MIEVHERGEGSPPPMFHWVLLQTANGLVLGRNDSPQAGIVGIADHDCDPNAGQRP